VQESNRTAQRQRCSPVEEHADVRLCVCSLCVPFMWISWQCLCLCLRVRVRLHVTDSALPTSGPSSNVDGLSSHHQRRHSCPRLRQPSGMTLPPYLSIYLSMVDTHCAALSIYLSIYLSMV
jgi:hypothetical protein